MKLGSFVLYHSVGSRSGRTKMMLDLLDVDYDLVPIDIRRDQHKDPRYLKLHPYGVVPTLIHNGRVILESAAQVMYLADLVPGRDLAPPLEDERRATYYELFVLGVSEMEARVIRAWQQPDTAESEAAIKTALDLYESRFVGPYFLGQQMTALDVFNHWSLRFFSPQSLAKYPTLTSYLELMHTRLDWSGY